MKAPTPRKGMPSPRLDKNQFRERFLSQFKDRSFHELTAELERVADAAWQAYDASRKSPITRKAGPGFDNPDYDLAVDWLDARKAILEAEERFKDLNSPCVLII